MQLTLDLGFFRSTVLESDRVPHCVAQLTSDFFTDTLRHRHGCHTSRLSAADDTVGSVAFFIQELAELSCLSGTCFAYDDDNCIVSYPPQS